jgi:Ca-activated chloride channel family protein
VRFHDPQLLPLLLLLAPIAFLIRRRERGGAAVPFAGTAALAALPETPRCRLARLLPFVRLPVLALLILALARPQAVVRESVLPSRGMDLMVALDLSSSMLAQDLAEAAPLAPTASRRDRESRAAVPGGDEAGAAASANRLAGERENRLEMAKGVLLDFIRRRGGDRIGLIAFAARPYAAAPLTLDHDWLRGTVGRLETGAIEDGTALGDAIMAAVNRLRDRPAQSRAVILITDGRSNAGTVSPELAAAAAKALGIRVHAIGIGGQGRAAIPVPSPLGGTLLRLLDADLDEATLRRVAATSGGSYFRAADREVLVRVFQQIDRLEKSTVRQKAFFSYRELYPCLLWAALALLLSGSALRHTLLRRLP